MNEESKVSWGKVIAGITLVLVAVPVSIVGFFTTIMAGTGGLGIMLFIFAMVLAVVVGFVLGGVCLILQGIGFAIRTQNNFPTTFAQILMAIILAKLLSTLANFVVSSPPGDWLHPFPIAIFLASVIAYYGIINKPWAYMRKAGMVILTFLILEILVRIPSWLMSLLSGTGQ